MFEFENPDAAISAIADRLSPVKVEVSASVSNPRGRILANSIRADRDSPAADVSAMDGYACVGQTLECTGDIPVIGLAAAGSPPPDVTADQLATGVVRIFTGGLVPRHADRIIRREDVNETNIQERDVIRWRDEARQVASGAHIRRAGENVPAGEVVLHPGQLLGAFELATLASFGVIRPVVYRVVRVAVLTTGDELRPPEQAGPIKPWELRNSNAVAIDQLLQSWACFEVEILTPARDHLDSLTKQIKDVLDDFDALILTGGVSMGDHDYVPAAVSAAGGDVVFHRLPIRPGKPIMGAVATRHGQTKPILGLPGNPVSATLQTVRFGFPILRKLAGDADWRARPAAVVLREFGDKTLPLHWQRGVCIGSDGVADLVIGKGSGDLTSLVGVDGFVEVPPGKSGRGPWPFFPVPLR